MEIGFIGLGKMGMNMVTRLQRDRHRVVVYDRSADLIKQAEAVGCVGAHPDGDAGRVECLHGRADVVGPEADMSQDETVGAPDRTAPLLDQLEVRRPLH